MLMISIRFFWKSDIIISIEKNDLLQISLKYYQCSKDWTKDHADKKRVIKAQFLFDPYIAQDQGKEDPGE